MPCQNETVTNFAHLLIHPIEILTNQPVSEEDGLMIA